MLVKVSTIENSNIKKQVPKNLAMNILSFGVNIIIGLGMLPYLVGHLGITAYGLIPLAMFFSEYIVIITQSLNSAINRFLLIALQKKDFLEANKIFNSSLVIMMTFGLFQILFMILIISDLGTFVNIPDDLMSDARWLFGFTFASFSLSLIQAVYTTPIYSFNRLDYIQSINIKRALIRVVLIVLLFSLDEPLLKYVGMANFSAALFVFVNTIYLSKKLAPQLKFNLTLFEKKRVKNIFSMGWWVLVQQVGGLLFLKVDLYIVNTYIDAYEAGRYAIIIQINTIMRMMIGVFASVVSPIIMIYYAKGEIEKLIKLSKFAVKGLGVLLSILIGFLCGIGGDLLTIWLDESFRTLELLLFLSLAPLVINLSMLPLFTINTAFNRVKFPGIVTLVLGFINILLSIFFATQTDLGVYGVLISGILLLSMKNVIFTPLYSSHILKISKIEFFRPLITTIFTFLFVYILTVTISSLMISNTILSLILIFILVIMISVIFVFYIVFSQKDKVLLWSIVPSPIKLKLKKIKNRIQNV